MNGFPTGFFDHDMTWLLILTVPIILGLAINNLVLRLKMWIDAKLMKAAYEDMRKEGRKGMGCLESVTFFAAITVSALIFLILMWKLM